MCFFCGLKKRENLISMLILIIHEKKITSFQTLLADCDSPLICTFGAELGLEHLTVVDISSSGFENSFLENSDESLLGAGMIFISFDCSSVLVCSFLLSAAIGSLFFSVSSFGMNSGTSGFKLSPIDEDMLSDSLSLPIVGIMWLDWRIRGTGGIGIVDKGLAAGQKSDSDVEESITSFWDGLEVLDDSENTGFPAASKIGHFKGSIFVLT